jgi:AcrR family transcriptional regulator
MSEAPRPSARRRLLASAAELIAEKGFDGVSVRGICAHAGTSNNMIHHYFGSKQGVLDAIVEEFSSGVFAIPMRILEREPQSQEEFLSIVELLFETTLEAYIEHRSVMLVVVREQASPEALPAYMRRLAEFLEEAKPKGFVRQQVDTEMVTGFFLDRILNQVQFAPWVKRTYGMDLLADPAYKKQWTAANLDIFLNGISS